PGSLLLRHSQIGEMSDSARTDPQSDSSRGASALQIVDHQRGLRGVVHVEKRFCPMDLDPDLRPFTGNQIEVAFVAGRRLRAQLLPGKIRVGNILGGMIALLLILGASILRPQVEALVPALTDPKREAGEAPGGRSRARSGVTRQIEFKDAILKHN